MHRKERQDRQGRKGRTRAASPLRSWRPWCCLRCIFSRAMPPNAPQYPQMPLENSIWQNEPTGTLLGAFGCFGLVRGLRQLALVNASWRQCTSTSIWQNEPTASHSGTFARGGVDARLHGLTPIDAGLPISRFGKTNPPRPQPRRSCDSASSSLSFSARFAAAVLAGLQQSA
jgi:hypothetical protein